MGNGMKSKRARIALTTVILFILDTVITYAIFNVSGSKTTILESIGYGGIPITLIYWVLIFAGIVNYDDPDRIDKECEKE